ncbi:MAG: 16S rRNA methyltransferase [Treponema sp.]|nr:16S rRNA methyltransferase [Treponema sp.]
MRKILIKTEHCNFDEYYKKIYAKRWQRLRESILLPVVSVSYNEGLASPYYLDRASILAALSLRLPKDETASLILDACAAPGGKTLVLASKMGKETKLLANEYSSERSRRLTAVLDRHLAPDLRSRVLVSGFNAAAAARRHSELGRFSSVLLDAPCSSERHVIQSKTALEKWTPARPRCLAQRQWSLLSAAFLMLESGGSLVYATCSINPEENDGVAGRLLNKYGNKKRSGESESYCIMDKPDFPEGEETEYGRLILPDTAEGAGPLYVARFKKSN